MKKDYFVPWEADDHIMDFWKRLGDNQEQLKWDRATNSNEDKL